MAETKSGSLRPKIIAGMPAYNEEKYIGTMVLAARQYADEIIVVDDGSTDNTAKIAAMAGATVIAHSENRGKGAAIQSLLSKLKKRSPDVLVLLDADAQHDANDIPKLIEPVLNGYDIVIGSRNLVKKSIPSYRRFGQRILLQFARSLTRHRISDSESGFRAFSKKAINEMKLTQNGFAIESEMIAAAEDKHLRLTEVPISVKYNGDGSTQNPFAHGFTVLARIMVMISERKPLFFFGMSGVILLICGMVIGIRVMQILDATHVLPVGTALVSVLFLIIGAFSVFTGIILWALAKRKI